MRKCIIEYIFYYSYMHIQLQFELEIALFSKFLSVLLT